MKGGGFHPPYGLREAGAQDAEAVAQVLGDWCREVDWMPKLRTREEDLWFAGHLIESQVVRLGFAGGGMGFLARQGGQISALYLSPAARGRGVGKALLTEAKVVGHLTLWCFQANLGARAFYAREGFREVEFTQGAGNDERLPDVRLEWTA